MSIVYDFPAIAKHLRRDDFFTPTPREKFEVEKPLYLICCNCLHTIAPTEPRTVGASGARYVRCTSCQFLNTDLDT